MRLIWLFATVVSLLPAQSALRGADTPPPNKDGVEFFEARIRPLLADRCLSCHGPEKKKGGVRLDSRAAMLKGNSGGPVLSPGEPDKSPIIRAVRQDTKIKMPPDGKLPVDAIDALTAWVKMGAPWPAADKPKADASDVAELRKSHWSFQPIRKPTVPTVKTAGWAETPLDRFILAKLDAAGLKPAPPADKRTLIRRAYLDLIGLPPTPEEVDAFVKDNSPDAFARVVDRLLASPQYGERWGRHWLDVARYADTKGYVFQEERRYPYAYTYRDYVIRAFNEDLPYDRFITEQLAADRLELGEDKKPLAAMGFLTLGRRFLNNTHDIIDDRIDVVSRGLMGLTVSCARCHDHKFDPIPTKDYYSLYGVFAGSVEPADLPLFGKPEQTAAYLAFEKELQARETKVNEFLETTRGELIGKFRARAGEYLLAAQVAPPPGDGQPRMLTDGELHPRMIARWRSLLEETKKKHHPVLAPWHAFAALPQKDFAAQASVIVKGWSEKKDAGKPINAEVVQAFAGKPPSSLQEVAKVYGDLLVQADQRWRDGVAKANETHVDAPTALPDAAWEEIRHLHYGPGSPPIIETADVPRFYNRAARDKHTALRMEVEKWKATSPAAPPRAMVLNDTPAPEKPHVFLRGNPNNAGEEVPRQFLLVLAGDQRKPFHEGSGRLELAHAIATPDNPLTARVLVNRVWQHHFGQGLVRTPSDFGLRGDLPTHPQLLDYLAATFMEQGWSIKKLHRMVLLSATYQQSSEAGERAGQADPENRLLAHVNRRRLEFEPLRDSLLFVAGRLDPKTGGPAVDAGSAGGGARRTVYSFIDRQNLPGLLRAFDFASPDTSNPQRHATTVPQQALFLMNNAFVVEQARGLLARPDVTRLPGAEPRIKRLYEILYSREPEADEMKLGRQFVEGPDAAKNWEEYAQVLLLANEFAFVD
jgi:hypothetical protein